MRKLLIFTVAVSLSLSLYSQLPCSKPEYRQFDFWLGKWDAYGLNGQKAGESRISLILDSCIVLEEWTSASVTSGLRYAGKSFNTYNSATKQWQQTWVDNTGGSNEYLVGKFVPAASGEKNKIIFQSTPFPFNKDTMAIRKLTFTNLSPDKLRQHGEISKDNGSNWITEYDLEYRRKYD